MSEFATTFWDYAITPGWVTPTTVVCYATDHVWAGTEEFMDEISGGDIFATSNAIGSRAVTGRDIICATPIVFPAGGQTPGSADVFIFAWDTGTLADDRIILVLEDDIAGIPYAVAGVEFRIVVEDGIVATMVG